MNAKFGSVLFARAGGGVTCVGQPVEYPTKISIILKKTIRICLTANFVHEKITTDAGRHVGANAKFASKVENEDVWARALPSGTAVSMAVSRAYVHPPAHLGCDLVSLEPSKVGGETCPGAPATARSSGITLEPGRDHSSLGISRTSALSLTIPCHANKS